MQPSCMQKRLMVLDVFLENQQALIHSQKELCTIPKVIGCVMLCLEHMLKHSRVKFTSKN